MAHRVDLARARAAFDRAAASGEEVFGDFFLTRLLGLEITYPEGACEVAFRIEDFMLNPRGTLHGGVLTTALDIAMGHLINHRAGGPGATLEIKVQFLEGPRHGRIICRAEALRQGGTWFLRAEARDEEARLVGHATSTWKLLKRPAPG